MTQIQAFIIGPDRRESSVTIPDDSEIRLLGPALVSNFRFPDIDSSGNSLVYRFRREDNDYILREDDTLATIGFSSGGKLIAMPMALMPAAPTLPSSVEHIERATMSAPIRIPSRESLAIGLVPSDLIYRLEEYRADQRRWEAIAWSLGGAVLGIVINWVTNDPITVSRASIILLIVLFVLAILVGLIARDFKLRADRIRDKINI
jgi:hypothetical protein